MKQVIQDARLGTTLVGDVPGPLCAPGHVLVRNVASLVSSGTERSVVELARKNIIGKARQRPDQVKRMLQKMRAEGLIATLQQVRAKLDEAMPLGYSTAGVVMECGRGVSEFKPGDRVATAGPHAEFVSVGKNLCARIPDRVAFEQAAYTSVGAIGLEGVRLARVSLGERVLVIGLGLIGQICVGLLKAQGCRVFGTDVDPAKLDLAKQFGADEVGAGFPVDSVKRLGNGHGVDAVVITAATASNEPIELAAEVCRPRGRIVLVGVVGLNLPRPPFFQKELEFTVSASLGPGRWDPTYEEKGIDYPYGQVRWTAQRNMEAVLDLIAAGKLPVESLTTHRLPIERAAEAYELITARKEPFLGVLLQYPEGKEPPRRRLELGRDRSPLEPGRSRGEVGISMIGAGNFARLTLLPALERLGGFTLRGLCTAKGLNAEHTGRSKGFAFAASDVKEVWKDPGTHAVFIVTRHDLHSELVVAALRAGKHVFVEKPLCIREEELAEIASTVDDLGERCPVLMVGFNRRFAPATARVREFMGGAGPLSMSFRFSPASLPAEHWTQDEELGGGRIVGEACHAIDTCVALAGSPPVRVFAESVARKGGLRVTDDRVLVTLRHGSGSISSISYQAGGDRAFPSERIEVFGGGRTAVIDAWTRVELWQGGKAEKTSAGRDKGHRAEVATFLNACREGRAWPIPWEQLYGVADATLGAVRALREGFPQDCGLPHT